jgi:hypothetical protein
MKNLINHKKRITYYVFMAVLFLNIKMVTAQDTLAPDQNPNYKKSLNKYMALKDSLTKNEGVTIQQTYKAIDDMQAKLDQRALRRSNRQARRLARINNRGYYYSSPYYGYGNYGYNRGYGNYGYNRGFSNYYGFGNNNFGYGFGGGFGNYGYGGGYNNYGNYGGGYSNHCHHR